MYVALDTTGTICGVAWESTDWRGYAPRRWYELAFATECQRTMFLRWAAKQVGNGPEDGQLFLEHWDRPGQFAPEELRAFLRIKWRDGNSAAVRAIRQTVAGARESLQAYYALNALLD